MNRTMVALLASLLVVPASAARAGEIEWKGTWQLEGGETRRLSADEKGSLSLETTLPIGGEQRTLELRGAPGGGTLVLRAEVPESRGIVGALSGERAKEGKREARAELSADVGTEGAVARATYFVGADKVREETWRRSSLVDILELRSDGERLDAAFDAKRSRTGLVVRYRVRGQPVSLAGHIECAKGHLYTSWYEELGLKDGIRAFSLGTMGPGEHEFVWDGRDASAARRIAVQGPYRVVLRFGPRGSDEAAASFGVARPRFEAIGAYWPESGGRLAWDTTPVLKGLGDIMSLKGYSFSGPRMVRDEEDALDALKNAACVVIDTHGRPRGVVFASGDPRRTYDRSPACALDASRLTPGRLKDLHLAIVTSCNGATDTRFRDPEKAQWTFTPKTSFVDALVSAGCDVAIGFCSQVLIGDTDRFEPAVLRRLEGGTAIEHAARVAARDVFRETHPVTCWKGPIPLGRAPTSSELDEMIEAERNSDNVVKSLAASIYVARAPGIPENEPLWPPRYGSSTN